MKIANLWRRLYAHVVAAGVRMEGGDMAGRYASRREGPSRVGPGTSRRLLLLVALVSALVGGGTATAVTVAVDRRGPSGPAGVQGPSGPVGRPGPPGAPGASGRDGVDGLDGDV